MNAEPSNTQIIGVAMVLFFSILLGVGIHHMVATGTCSSTGYSANYGPVPTCPSGTGWWFLFLFAGIIGALVGAMMAGTTALVFAGIFGGIGVGALTIILDSGTSNGTKIFGGVFGGCFAVVGIGAWIAVLNSAMGSMRSAGARPSPGGTGDPILGAYNAASSGAAPMAPPRPTPMPTPATFISGLQPASGAAPSSAVDELAKLADLHKRGAVTDAEFASAKAKLLGEM
jgi:hypothetical protein